MGSKEAEGENKLNFKLVLKAYSTLRQLSDDESALLTTLRGMNESERESLVLAMQPETPVKKKRKPRGDNKSQRASNMAATLNRSLAQQREAATKDITGESEPSAPICDTCGNLAGYVDHFQPSPSYHPFTVKGVAQAASAGD
jgi:hypothetical protein